MNENQPAIELPPVIPGPPQPPPNHPPPDIASEPSSSGSEEGDEVWQCLQFIGLGGARAERIMEEGLETYEDFRTLTEDDIQSMVTTMSKRTIADGRVVIKVGESRKLKALMHWIQDFYRCSDEPSFDVLNQDALRTAADRAKARQNAKQNDSSALMPDKFTTDKQWDSFYKATKVYLSTLLGVNGVPLVYIIRENELPKEGMDDASHVERCIARAPLKGNAFESDARQVHLIITQLVADGPGEQWIESISPMQNGRLDMAALYNQYAGAGNYIRQMAVVQKIRDTLHYKSERTVPFSTFLQRLQKMFQIAMEQDEPYADRAKCRELLQRCIPCTHLAQTIAALKVEMTRGTLTYNAACNHLQAEVYANQASATSFRNVSATFSNHNTERNNKKGKPARGKQQGSPFVPWAKWNKMSEAEKQRHRSNRKKGKPKPAETEHNRSVQATDTNSQRTVRFEDEEPSSTSAGNAFGGRSEASNR